MLSDGSEQVSRELQVASCVTVGFFVFLFTSHAAQLIKTRVAAEILYKNCSLFLIDVRSRVSQPVTSCCTQSVYICKDRYYKVKSRQYKYINCRYCRANQLQATNSTASWSVVRSGTVKVTLYTKLLMLRSV